MLVLIASTVFAAEAGNSAEIKSRYEQERALCLKGMTSQDQATCMREAGAARDAAKKGKLKEGSPDYQSNAKTRCEALPTDQVQDCLARARGEGGRSGSVEGGGILRQTVTVETAPAAAPASAASAAASAAR
ncbi:MAG: hypothetical protein ABIQ60_14550 [Burkholderiaceae bacterium]